MIPLNPRRLDSRVSDVASIAEVLASDDVMGVLTRDTSVRLVNISVSGCLLESSHRFDLGTTGALEVLVGDELLSDAVRVSRVQPVFGRGVAWHIGLEFLWTTHPGSRSLRRMVKRLRRDIATQAATVAFSTCRVM